MKLLTSAIIRKSSFFLLGGMTAAAGLGVYSVGNILEKMAEQKPQGNNPVAIHATMPASRDGGISTLPFASTSHLRRTAGRHAITPTLAGDAPSGLPTATMNSTSLFSHSGAVVVTGAGGHSMSNNGGGSMQVHSTVEDAKRAGSISRGGNLLALSSATMITSPGATNAASIATMAVNSSISSGPRKGPPADDPEPFPDEDTPVGATPFVLMALLAAAYATFCYRKNRKSV